MRHYDVRLAFGSLGFTLVIVLVLQPPWFVPVVLAVCVWSRAFRTSSLRCVLRTRLGCNGSTDHPDCDRGIWPGTGSDRVWLDLHCSPAWCGFNSFVHRLVAYSGWEFLRCLPHEPRALLIKQYVGFL